MTASDKPAPCPGVRLPAPLAGYSGGRGGGVLHMAS